MPYQLSFRFQYDYGRFGDGVSMPVALSTGTASLEILASVDTGADYCFFERSLVEDLDLDFDQGIPLLVSTVAGGFRASGFALTLSVLGIEVDSVVYFYEDTGISRNVLGRNGWLNRVRLALVEHDSAMYLSAYDD